MSFLKEKIGNLRDYARPRLIVTHPLRIALWFILIGPLLFMLSVGSFLGLLTFFFAPWIILAQITRVDYETVRGISMLILCWIFGVGATATCFYLATAGFLIYCCDMLFTGVLAITGKTTQGEIIETWTTSSRAGNTTTTSDHCKVRFVHPVLNKETTLTGSSQRSFLRRILETNFEAGKTVCLVYHPRVQAMVRMKHQ